MATIEQPCYTLLNYPSSLEQPNEQQLKNDLEHGTTKIKIKALKNVIHMIANGERLPGILMHIIRFVLPSQDHTIKKLLLIFWELVPKTTPDGKLMQEMILVCDAYRKDLQHPNEFIRGSTLRFLCKLKEPELLEPLMPSIRGCLEHKISYVRRNAVLAIFTIYKNFEFLIPDAPELIATFLDGEQDMSCKRNAFLMLLHADQERALAYLVSCLEQVSSFGDILQLVIVQLIYKVCQANPSERSRFIRCIYSLLNSNSPAVRYEAAGTLITLSSAPTAIKAAASCYIDLIVKESDNNVKLIVLDRLIALKKVPTHEKVLQELVMDVLRVLSSPDIEVKQKALQLALDLTTSQSVEEVVLLLKKEMQKTNDLSEQEDTGKYRQLLVRSLHSCSINFPEVAPTVIPVLMEFLSDPNEMGSYDIIVFVREAIHKFESLRNAIIRKLLEVFPLIKSARVHRVALWILGEYSVSAQDIQEIIKQIKASLGDLPLTENKDTSGEQKETTSGHNTLVTSDGTYATQSTFSMEVTSKKEEHPPLKQYLMQGDFFLSTSIASTLTKLALRFKYQVKQEKLANHLLSECMLVISSIMTLGKSGLPVRPISKDDLERMLFFIRVLSDQSSAAVDIFTSKCRNALANLQLARDSQAEAMVKVKEKSIHTKEVDDPIQFLQLSPKESDFGSENVFESSLNQAVSGSTEQSFSVTKLSKITQLTGFSDPVYAEAFVNVNQYDIVLDVLIVNKTGDTLQNVIIEFVTQGDLKLVDKPQPFILAPFDFCSIKTSIKVASTENSIIFGNITYDVCGASSEGNVVLNDILIDIMDYIVPSPCTDGDFIRMWAEFEWENKVSVSTNITDLHEYLTFVTKIANMHCLNPEQALSGQCGLMAANLYAKSIFGEDVLANLSIEKPTPDSPILGHVRLRAKSRGIALSLGDKISKAQKQLHSTPN